MSLPMHAKITCKVCLDCRLAQIKTSEAAIASLFPFDPGTTSKFVNAAIDEGTETRSKIFTTVLAMYEEYATKTNNCEAPSCAEAELANTDSSQLTNAGIIKLWSGKDILGKPLNRPPRNANVRAFTTAEKNPASRRRFVSHTPDFNDGSVLPLYTLPSPKKLMAKVKKYAYAYHVDFKFYFAQFMLPTRLSSVFIFRDAGKWFELNTIPTGASSCPIIAQLFSEALAALLMARFKSQHVDMSCDVYIDNIRILAQSLEQLQSILKELFAICKEYLVDVNESFDEVVKQQNGRSYVFLGIEYNHEHATTQISETLRLKLLQGALLLTNCNPQQLADISLRKLTSMLGVAQHASLISGGCKSEFYPVMKFFRRRAAAAAFLDDAGDIWPSIKSNFIKWMLSEARKEPRIWTADNNYERSCVMYTDASNTGMGAVMYSTDGSISIIAAPWFYASPPHINILEAVAVRNALRIFNLEHIDNITLLIDNTSVMYTLQKGCSKSFELNCIIHQIMMLGAFAKVKQIRYVESRSNRADLPSRLGFAASIHLRITNPLFGALLQQHPDSNITQTKT